MQLTQVGYGGCWKCLHAWQRWSASTPRLAASQNGFVHSFGTGIGRVTLLQSLIVTASASSRAITRHARQTVGDRRLCQGCSGPSDGFLQLDPEGVPLAQRFVVASEYLGALVIKAHPLDRRAREHAEPKQIQSESDPDERHPARVHAVPLSESLERHSSISARAAESSRHATSRRASDFHGFG